MRQSWLFFEQSVLFQLPKCSGSKAIKRFARPVLSRAHNRNFLPLWGRFAAAEWTQGGGASAGRPLFEAALRFSPGQVLAEPLRHLWEVWAQLGMLTTQAELEWALGMITGDLDPVKKLLVSLLEPCDDSGNRSVGPALLRVSKAAEGLWERARGGLAGGEAGEAGRMLVFRVRAAFADLCVLRLLLLLLVRPEVEAAAQEAHTWLQPLPASFRVTATARLTAVASAFAASRFLSPAPIQRLAAAEAIGAPDEPGAVQLVLRASGRSGLLAPLRVTFEHMLSTARCAHTWASIIEMEEARLERFPGKPETSAHSGSIFLISHDLQAWSREYSPSTNEPCAARRGELASSCGGDSCVSRLREKRRVPGRCSIERCRTARSPEDCCWKGPESCTRSPRRSLM